MSQLPFNVTVIADYGPLHDMAFAEVTQSISSQMEGLDSTIKEYSVPAFDTYSTGFFLAQTALNSRLGKRHLFFVNTAPRHDDDKPKAKAEGEKLVYVQLKNDVRILAVNSGYSLSFLKPDIKEARIVNVENEGSQFRSRDFYPKVLGEIARDDYRRITEREPEIPDMPRNVVCFTDGYGNLKTSVNPDELKGLVGEFLSVAINGYKHYVKVGRSIFDVPDGHMCIAPGSSGWTHANGDAEEFVEIVCRSGNASKIFKQPKSGTSVQWDVA